MAEYLDIGKETQRELLRNIKLGCDKTWDQLAKEMGINRSMIFFYLNGKCKIPREKFKILSRNSTFSINPNELNFAEMDFVKKAPRLPTISEEMAEFLGIMYGDGCISSYNYTIDISGDKRSDILYHTSRLHSLILHLFGISLKRIIQRNCVHTRISTKTLCTYLNEEFSFPIGVKKGQMHIPDQVYEKEEYKRAFLRGLFDTDGGIDYHHFRSSQIHYTCYDATFKKEVFDLYRSLNFNVKSAKRDIKMFDRGEISRFFNEICPANPKHQYKYRVFLETGWVPRHRDIDYSLLHASAGNRTQVQNLEGSDVTIAPRSQ